MFTWLRSFFRSRSYDSEYARGRREAAHYALTHGPIDCRITVGSAVEDRDFCQGAERGFPCGWIDYMRSMPKIKS